MILINAIWHARNSLLWEDKPASPALVSQLAGLYGCVWYAGRDGTERDEAFRPAFGAPKMGGTGRSTGQILGVFAFHLPPLERTNIPHVFFKNYTFVPSRPVPSRPVCVPNAPYLSDYLSAQPAPLHRLQQSPSHWSPPLVHWMKINVDGSFCSSTNFGGVRCEVMDTRDLDSVNLSDEESVEIIMGTERDIGSESIDNTNTSIANKKGRAINLGLVQAMGSLHSGSTSNELLIDDIKTRVLSFNESRVCHVRCFANSVAHKLAKLILVSNNRCTPGHPL
ncbi:hypothetical protein DVH24_023935 [Malus domestica]|uniref:Uncharacterized protein n=1 Tax=Malus domestica TaxID=3750 RepID=A0A498JLQ3_MALDO|nr:hypothetical protein DVH24_023935 [Malus domestica]